MSPAIQTAAQGVGRKIRVDWPLLLVVPATGTHIQMQPLARLLVLLALAAVVLWQVQRHPAPKTSKPAKPATPAAPAAQAVPAGTKRPAPARKAAATRPAPKKAVPAQRGSGGRP